jgi:hypothetical protein
MEFTQEQLQTLLDSVNPEQVMQEPLSVNALRDMVVNLAEEKELLKAQLKEIDSKLEQALMSLGVGEVFQANDGTVFKVQEPTGTFISFKKIDYVRTRKEGEKGGNYLSKKEAEELGFKVK